jgi:protein TonB
MSYAADPQDEEPGFFRRYGVVLAVVALVAAAGVVFAIENFSGQGRPPRPAPQIVAVRIAPLPAPPPPPPPPPQQIQPEQKMVEQAPIEDTEQKPDDQPQPAPPLGTNIAGNGGPDTFGLGANAGGSRLGGGPRQVNSPWGWYAAQVQTAIGDALRQNVRTRNADLRIEVRVWPDVTGRITRAALAGTSGDPAIDAVLRDDILTGLQLREPPPKDMPLPIVMRLTARRPN